MPTNGGTPPGGVPVDPIERLIGMLHVTRFAFHLPLRNGALVKWKSQFHLSQAKKNPCASRKDAENLYYVGM